MQTTAEMIAAARGRTRKVEVNDASKVVADPSVVIGGIRNVRKKEQADFVLGSVQARFGTIEFWIDPDRPYFKDVSAQPNKTHLFQCASGWRSALTVAMLQDMDFDALYLRDGFPAWAAQNDPIERKEKR